MAKSKLKQVTDWIEAKEKIPSQHGCVDAWTWCELEVERINRNATKKNKVRIEERGEGKIMQICIAR